MDCSSPGSSAHGIFQARVLEWVAISFSRGSSRPRDRTRVSRTAGRRFTTSKAGEEVPLHWFLNDSCEAALSTQCERCRSSEKVGLTGLAWPLLLMPSETQQHRGSWGSSSKSCQTGENWHYDHIRHRSPVLTKLLQRGILQVLRSSHRLLPFGRIPGKPGSLKIA